MRVFNLSLHRVATTSVWRALKQLGFKSHHFGDVYELFLPYIEGRLEECRWIFDDNQAFGDLPIPIMYRKLYELFPDAKYLLVVRDFKSWLESIQKHFAAVRRSPINHMLNAFVYGYPILSDFDESVCRRTYDRHNADVQNFFAGKDNLLTLRLENLAWKPICEFLEYPEPNTPFPNVTYQSEVARGSKAVDPKHSSAR